VKALGYVQIDTLHVVNRAHYVTLWARFGSYDIDDFHRLLYTPGERRLYEGWGHAASIIPLEHYRFHRWRTDPEISYNPGFQRVAEQTATASWLSRRWSASAPKAGCALGISSTTVPSATHGMTGSPPRWRWRCCSPGAT
jgi:uncharacterized protein YcaQ